MLSTDELQLAQLAINNSRYGCVAPRPMISSVSVSESLSIEHDDVFSFDDRMWLDPNEGEPYLWIFSPESGEFKGNLFLSEHFNDPFNPTEYEVLNFLFLFPEFTGILLEVGIAWRKHESGELNIRYTTDFSVQGGECD